MAKLRKYPKKPKAKASAATLERYLQRCKEIDRLNAPIKAEMKKKEALQKKVNSIRR